MRNITLIQLMQFTMEQAKEKGFGVVPKEVNALEKIALIHSELSEAMEAYRRKKIRGKNGFAEELADVIIRVLHLAGIYKIDIEKEILKKLNSNKNRQWKWEKMNEGHA